MRILQLIPQSTIGGAETFAYILGRELTRRGHEVLLLANRKNGPLFEMERPPEMRALALDRGSRLDPRILSFLIGSIRRFRPDILHSHNFEANTWARALGPFFPHLAVVCHDHSGRKIHQPAHRIWIDRILFRNCGAVIVVNNELGELLRQRHRVPEKILHVVPNGVDLSRYQTPPDAEPNPSGLVCVASLTDVKNHAGLLQAFREVVRVHPAARLTLVGEGPRRADLEAQAREAGISSHLAFAGLLADIRPALWSNSVFVLFSHREALPLSLLEAMAAGLASVASNVGGIPQVLSDGVTGRLVPPGDVPALTAALLEFLREPQKAREAGARAREIVAGTYGLQACVNRIETIYREVLKKGKGGRQGTSRS